MGTYFGRARVDDDHESNFRFLFCISLDYPLLPLNYEVMKVRFWRQCQFVFRKNDKPETTETKNEAEERKVQFFAVILVPMPAPNSQYALRTVRCKLRTPFSFPPRSDATQFLCISLQFLCIPLHLTAHRSLAELQTELSTCIESRPIGSWALA